MRIVCYNCGAKFLGKVGDICPHCDSDNTGLDRDIEE